MSGGGDTPTQNTYWAYEFESGKYVLGYFQDDELNIECGNDSSDIWVVNAEGVYTENIALHSYLESEIVDAINAKYGTNFTELTVKQVSDISIGDDCPDWDEYEKINGLWGSFAVSTRQDNTTYFICSINGHEALFQTRNSQMPFVSPAGIITVFGPTVQGVGQWCVDKITEQYGGSIISIETEETQLNVGDEISGWNNYTKINN